MRFPTFVGLTSLLAVMLLAGCRGESNSNNAPASSKQIGGEQNTAASPAQGSTAQATTKQEETRSETSTTSEGGALAAPVTDAVAMRDQLLELARGAVFNPQSSASTNADAIRAAWRKQYPGLKFVLFYSMPADANSVSASDTFLISGASGNYDQLYSFAVTDTKGKCAAGAAVIPGDTASHKVSEAKLPTMFVPIDMSSARSCSGRDAGDNYKP
ncbi:MAG: hypothetical protein QOF02_3353 [Blastocatellia bacterium]|nr:hypothetical protein [Blastocatellia bacterium]